MERRTYVWIFIVSFVIVLSVSLIYFILFSGGKGGPIASPENVENLKDCEVLSYSGEEAINIVFLSSKTKAESYANFFLSNTPFNLKEYKNKFNFFLIENHGIECDIYKGIALLCPQKEAAKRAAACPNDYIVVTEKKPSSIRSSAYMNVMSLNEEHNNEVFMHEFGHVFGGLAEEYVDERAKIPRGAENCLEECGGFGQVGSDTDGCFEGCTKGNYFRSVENGVMRTLSPDKGVMYGLFDESILKNRIAEDLETAGITGNYLGITGNAVSNFEGCENKKYLRVEFDIVDGELREVGENVASGCAGGIGYGNEFGYRVISDGKTVLERGFDPETLRAEGPGPIDDKGYIPIDSDIFQLDNFVVEAQIVEGVDELNLIDKTGKVSKINLRNAGARACKI